jgi:hypothetical protein
MATINFASPNIAVYTTKGSVVVETSLETAQTLNPIPSPYPGYDMYTISTAQFQASDPAYLWLTVNGVNVSILVTVPTPSTLAFEIVSTYKLNEILVYSSVPAVNGKGPLQMFLQTMLSSSTMLTNMSGWTPFNWDTHVQMENVVVTAVNVTPSTAQLPVGSTLPFSAGAVPTDAPYPTLTWTISPQSVAIITPTGVKAVSPGTAIVTATAGNGLAGTATITVIIPAKSMTLSQDTLTLAITAAVTLTASVQPSNATSTAVTWSSSFPTIVSVGPITGVVTANGAGTATITATTADGSGVTASATVTVTPPVPVITHGRKPAKSKKVLILTLVAACGVVLLVVVAVAVATALKVRPKPMKT